MRFNAYLYVIIWTLSIGFNLFIFLWPKFNINVINTIQESLKSYPLIEFDLTENKTNNETKDKNRLGPFFKWPGLYELAHDSYNDEDYYKTVCPPNYMYKIYGYYFDYTKYKTYEELLNNGNIIKKNSECKNGYKNCGVIDTLEQQLCLPENISCPINDIQIIDSSYDSFINPYKEKGYDFKESRSYSENRETFRVTFLYSNNQTDKSIIGRILLSANWPCANPTEFSWEKSEYIENTETKICKNKYKGNLYDKTYERFGTIKYNILYEDNLNSHDYYYADSKDSRKTYIDFFQHTFIGVDRKCLKDSNIKDIPNSLNMVDFLDWIRYCSLAFAILNFLFVVLIINFDLCLDKYSDNDSDNDSYLDIPEKFYLFLNSVAFVLYMFTFVYFTERTVNFDCSDDIINDKIHLLNRQMLIMKISTLGYNILFFIFVVIVISGRIYKKINGNNIFSNYFKL